MTTFRKFQFRPGFVLILEFSARGGVSYRRETTDEETDGESLHAQLHTHKTVDHVTLNRRSRAIINAAYHVVDRHATNTPLGYWATAEVLAEHIAPAITRIQEDAEDFNLAAQAAGSARRVNINLFPVALSEDNETAARRVAVDVQERIQALKDALWAADRKAFETAWDAARNLDRMAVGIQADAIRTAMDHAKETKSHLLEALREGVDVETIRTVLDLEPLDAAISLFQVEV